MKQISSVSLAFLLSLFACKTGTTLVKKIDIDRDLKVADILHKTDSVAAGFHYINARFSAEIRNKNKSETSVKGKMRACRDSAVWLSVTPALGIEVARMLVTSNEAGLIDYFHKNYYTGNYEELASVLRYPLSVSMIQNLLFARYTHSNLTPVLSYNQGKYFLSTVDYKTFDKIVSERKKFENLEQRVEGYWIEPGTWLLSKVLYYDGKQDRLLEAVFKNFQPSGSVYLPGEANYRIVTDTSGLSLKVQFSKYELPESLEFPFNVPDGYEKARMGK